MTFGNNLTEGVGVPRLTGGGGWGVRFRQAERSPGGGAGGGVSRAQAGHRKEDV